MPAILKSKVKTEFSAAEETGPHAGLGSYEALLYSDTGGLSQFGAFVEILHPGSFSSHRHWHENEDEFIYMIAGDVVLIEEDGEYILGPGDAATFKAGVANGHHLHNRNDKNAHYLVVGTRAENERAHYSDIDRLYVRENGEIQRTKRDGTPL